MTLGPAVTLLGVIGHLRTLLQRAVTLAVDAGVMDKQVLLAVIGVMKPNPLSSLNHFTVPVGMWVTPPRYVRALRGGCC